MEKEYGFYGLMQIQWIFLLIKGKKNESYRCSLWQERSKDD
jgi:hypothetical protein